MIAGLAETLDQARREGTAVAGFSCYDAETAAGVLQAAAGRPLVLLIPARLVALPGGDLVASALRAMAERAPSPVCVELDHAHDVEVVRKAIDCGIDAVMADGSHLPFEENLELVRRVRALGAVCVEAAIGEIDGDEDVAHQADPGPPADPAEAARLVRESGADCVSVAVGNVHGHYRQEPALDLPLIRDLAAAVDVPLVLHGGSGLSPAVTRAAAEAGIAKVNYNTELRGAYLRRTRDELPRAAAGSRLLDLHRAQIDAVAAVAADKLAGLTAGRTRRLIAESAR